ncbi:MAG: ArnT family glycosyltransferase, partial [Isosphaeraceae bacterium]
VSLAAFGAAAIFAWLRAIERKTCASMVLAGVCSGLALGVKYPALVLVALLGLAILSRPILDRSCHSCRGLACALGLGTAFLAATVVVGGGWYLRAYIHTGNPVFPFFKSFFGGAGLEEVLAPIKRPLATNPLALLSALVPLTLEPQRFDSFAHQFGPLFLLFLPALLLERPPRRVLGLAGLGYAFLILCMTQRQSMRFLLIALGPMSVGVAYLASRWCDRRTLPARALVVVLILVLTLETGIALARAGRVAGTVLGTESFAHCLARIEPTFRVGRWVDEHLPRRARLIGQDHRGFYIPRDYTMELAHRRRTGLGSSGESSRQIVETLKKEGYTHLMLCPPEKKGEIEFDPTLSRLLSPWLLTHTPLYHEDLTDPDGVVRHYSIYALGDGERTAKAAGNESLRR